MFFATGLIGGSGEFCQPTYPGYSNRTEETCNSYQTDEEKSTAIAFKIIGGLATVAGLGYAFKDRLKK